MAPLFSIITVCLNCNDKLLDTVKSLLNQTFEDYEFIIKDGGSTDGTLEIITDLDADLVVSTSDNGIFDAMNQAIKLSRGEYIYFLNAGDLLYNNKVLEDVANSIKTTNKKVDLFYGDIVKPYARRKYLFHPKILSGYYMFSRGLCHQSWFLRREVYLRYGGFKPYFGNIGGDYRLLLKIYMDGKITMHLKRFIAIYEGGGANTELSLLKKRVIYERKTKKEMFGRVRYYIYQSMYLVESWLKKIIYDKFLYLVFNKINEYRFNKRGC